MVEGYVATADGRIMAVRVSSNGNLVGALASPSGRLSGALDGLVSRDRDRGQWPHIYPTQAEAEAAVERRQASCWHEFRMLSHEERHCHRCGLVEFVPDV